MPRAGAEMRRRALAGALGVVLVTSACAPWPAVAPNYDLIVANARIVDGSGAPGFRGDIGIRDDRISAVGDLDGASAPRTIDARGLVAAPGFIDMHSHASWLFLVDSRAASALTQGITLVVEGEGESVAPVTDAYLAERLGDFQRYGIRPDWRTLADFFQRLEAAPGTINFATYVGTGTIRELVVGREQRAATAAERLQMERLVAEAMEDGALGVYSALMYVPDLYNTTEDLVAMASVAARYGGAYQTHQRSEGDALFESLAEVERIAREAGIRTNITHLKAAYVANWGEMPIVVRQIEAARDAGRDIAADVYPYLWGSAQLLDILPPWARLGSRAEVGALLQDRAARERVRRELVTPTTAWENEYLGVGGSRSFVIIDVMANESLMWMEGENLADIAARRDQDARDTIMDIVAAGGAAFVSHLTNAEDLEHALRQPWVSFGSDGDLAAPDGPLSAGLPHPRAYGTFPRILGRYVRDRGLLTIEEAIRKSTSLPASRLGLADRGMLREGYYADIVLLDAERVIDLATYQQPHQYSAGIEYVLVNGQVVLDRGRITDARPGRVIRGPGYEALE
jgi:N-acyl-D-amino-acid deacylase